MGGSNARLKLKRMRVQSIGQAEIIRSLTTMLSRAGIGNFLPAQLPDVLNALLEEREEQARDPAPALSADTFPALPGGDDLGLPSFESKATHGATLTAPTAPDIDAINAKFEAGAQRAMERGVVHRNGPGGKPLIGGPKPGGKMPLDEQRALLERHLGKPFGPPEANPVPKP